MEILFGARRNSNNSQSADSNKGIFAFNDSSSSISSSQTLRCHCPRKYCFLCLATTMLMTIVILWSVVRPLEYLFDRILPEYNATTAPPEGGRIEIDSSVDVVDRHFFQFYQCQPGTSKCCNGLENLCTIPVNQIMFASVNNAVSTKEDGTFINYNHHYKLEKALDAGYRSLRLQVCNCAGVYQFCTGICSLGSRDPIDVFLNLQRFLRDHPQDVLMVQFKLADNVDQPVSLDNLFALMENVTEFTKNIYRHNPAFQWPTPDYLIAANRILLLFHSDGPSCNQVLCPPGMHYWYDFAMTTWSNFSSIDEIADRSKSCQIAAPVSNGQNLSRQRASTLEFFQVEHGVTPVNENISQGINQFDFLYERLSLCSEQQNDQAVNVVTVDFWHEGDVIEVVQRYNTALRPARRMLRQ